ncbi:MAG: MerR family transcriptional regulator [Epsilonproteobacteria bacterium]|nr:MerR family transcriptional regulator [Campylobacterota bacterium]
MKMINDKQYYKMSELAKASGISNYTISFYNKKGLIPNSINTSKNMKYYPTITLTVLNLIQYLKENLNFSIDYIKTLFDYYNVDFEDREEFVIQAIEMISYEITNPIPKNSLKQSILANAIHLGLLEDKEIYFKTEVEVLNIFIELTNYDISTKLVREYIETGKRLAILEKQLSDTVYQQKGYVPEVLVLDILNKLKPFILNSQTINAYKGA